MEISRQYYTEEFKQEAVKLIRESGFKLSEAANRLNISAQTLKNWLYPLGYQMTCSQESQANLCSFAWTGLEH